MPRKISSASSLDTLRKEARRWVRALRAGDVRARARFNAAHQSPPAAPTLRDVQHALAREYGHDSWMALSAAVRTLNADSAEGLRRLTVAEFDQLAADFLSAFNVKDDAALQRVNAHYQRQFTFEDLWAEIWRRVYSFRQRAFRTAPQALRLDEVRVVIAQDAGFPSWQALTQAAISGAAPVPAFVVDAQEQRIQPRRRLLERDWDALIAAMRDQRIARLDADGLMTDDALARVATLNHVTALSLGGSRQLTDDGLRHLARMPQLEHLDLSEYPGGTLTDRGLEVLRHLPNLKTF